MDIFIQSKRHRINPQSAIAKGGEADIFRLRNGDALKLFKPPSHPDYQPDPAAQQMARERLAEHQLKLKQFPEGLPPTVIRPTSLACDRSGTILGYTMPWMDGTEPLMKYGDRAFRQASGIPQQSVIEIFQSLWATVSKLHFAQVVIGDFNDLNVLIRDTTAYLIDSDSFQFGPFPSRMFTPRYRDPLLMDAGKSNAPFLPDHADWYAFTTLLMQSLLYVHPYGGVYKPKNAADKVPHEARPQHRITVFHPEVKYPKPAIPFGLLPDDLLHHFHQVFEKDVRGEFPESLLQSFRWTTCGTCGTEHGRDRCPNCTQTTAAIPKRVITVRGSVTANRIFSTEGVILCAAHHRGHLRWVYGDRQCFRREDGSTILEGTLSPHLHVWLQGDTTWIGQGNQVVGLHPSRLPERIPVDCRGTTPLFATTESGWYRVHQSHLERSDSQGWPPPSLASDPVTPLYASTRPIGTVLPQQTYFWVGSQFGVGFYRAGHLSIGFLFDAHRSGLNDQLNLDLGTGHILKANCVFGQNLAWLFLATQEQGTIQHRCAVIQANGDIVAIAQATSHDSTWLSTLGGCAVHDFLLTPTDDGIARIEPQNGQLIVTKTFPDTESFVDTSSHLIPGHNELYVIKSHEILALKIR